ncbi:hypothetical protein PanWU01x14_012370 [Parasponia andersonii]|uniref:Uncharacterized protein n=1 Tax=Parasponia andersonii TaxID=3476 RepID=A0A2P5E1S5_PARAD|nr:hypothetical protein PanWU01x14_012370 [Parasponia andersonii]
MGLLLMSFKSKPIGLASLHCSAHIMVRNFEHFGNSNSPFRSYSTSLPYPSKSSAPEAPLDGMAGTSSWCSPSFICGPLDMRLHLVPYDLFQVFYFVISLPLLVK